MMCHGLQKEIGTDQTDQHHIYSGGIDHEMKEKRCNMKTDAGKY